MTLSNIIIPRLQRYLNNLDTHFPVILINWGALKCSALICLCLGFSFVKPGSSYFLAPEEDVGINGWEVCSYAKCGRHGARKFGEGEHVEFCRRGAAKIQNTSLGAAHRTHLAHFSEICLHMSINWGIVTCCDILQSYWFMGDKYQCK